MNKCCRVTIITEKSEDSEWIIKFENDDQIRTLIALRENAKIQARDKNPVIQYFITEYHDDVETRVWLSHDNLIPGLKAETWYLIHKEEDAMGHESVSYAEDTEEGDGPSD